VSVGAILSNYQRVRVEHVCQRLSLTPLCYLWQRDQAELLTEMIDSGLEAILIKVAGIGLTSKHLGKSLLEMQPTLVKLVSVVAFMRYTNSTYAEQHVWRTHMR
jgi:diphthine-ammonia ligase